ncbi:MAG: glycosyl hydrolase [Muribaculaceae bacterium]
MLKNFKHIFAPLISLALAVCVTSCSSSGDEPDPEPTPSVPLTVVKQSIQNDAEVPATTTSITIEYSHPIALSTSVNITLNSKVVVPTASNKTLTVPLSLEEGNTYQLLLPQGAVVRKDDKSVKSASLTINFKTPDPIKPSDIAPLTNSSATSSTKKVYEFLVSQYGKKTLSGTMANVSNNNEYSDLVYSVTKKHPALTGYDYIHLPYSPANWIDYNDIKPAKTQWDNNGLVSYMWHWLVPPTEGAKIEDYSMSANNGFDIREALKEGTWQNKQILADIEKVAGYLKLLQDAGIPVLWRPLHEAAGSYSKYQTNGAWFWWGDKGAEYTKQLWILLHDKLVKEYGLNNLIWVWTVQCVEGFESAAAAAYPGNDYVDIVGADIYASDTESKLSEFNFINNNITRGKKMITLSECGNIPNPAKTFASGDTWSWFMVWYCRNASGNLVITDSADDNFKYNTENYWKQVLGNSNIINREDMPSLK